MPDTESSSSPPGNLDAFRERLDELARAQGPTVFGLRTPLPAQGRTDVPLAATGSFSVVLKTYASGGENALHGHVNEDHVFIVMQGAARFTGKDGVLCALGRHQGILIPAGTLYRFEAVGEEPLVLIRVGAVTGEGLDRFARIGPGGESMDAFSAENKQVELVYAKDAYFD